MVTINVDTSLANNRLGSTAVRDLSPASVLPLRDPIGAPAVVEAEADNTLSILGRQLSDVANHDARISQADPGNNLSNPLDAISDERYFADKAQHDAEVPDTHVLELLERAKQATAFANGLASNPFRGLSVDQLTLIARDESGTFTVNERRAAWQEVRLNELRVSTSSGSVIGRELMISRIFLGQEPAVAEGTLTFSNMAQSSYDFLTRDDRSLLSEMYAYAQEQGADLAYVDMLAYDLGNYRHHDNGRQLLSGNNGYNQEGRRVTFNFKEHDVTTVSRILNGSAIDSTRLEQGFLRHVLNPDFGALSNMGSIAFLEQMVLKFSSAGATQASLGREFATYAPISINDNMVVTVAEEVTLTFEEPVLINTDGIWTITEKGKAAGYTMDLTTGKPHRAVAPSVDDREPRSIIEGAATDPLKTRSLVDTVAGTPDRSTTRWRWPGHLFELMKNPKT
ncbi:hypothetical protein CER19_07705 [Pseudomonas sp. GL93]|uniref:hypothetical protein n=1 Tax=Pseudomonas sp. GL93 TaxID=2014741 RepID=UPI000E321900|nr:hypothetical protein [Pseudomonas sp. GL93]RFD30776.1 hypothetical protein CER19_07705 [Pseudomonas sp. GL93]